MSKEDFAKLQGIEAGAQVNKIETITKRVLLNVVDKNVTIPEDIAISPDEPTNNEIIWMDTDEDYDFTFDGYSKVDADARFVHQVEGKDLSTNDYSNADKNKVNNLNSYVTSGSFAQDANNAAITLNIKDPVTDNNSNQVLTINKATSTTAGVMSAADKTKLDGLSNYDDSTITQDITNIKANKLETVEVTGTGNVITTVTKNGTKIAFAKGITAMTQDTSDARYVKKTGDIMTGPLKVQEGIRLTYTDNIGYLQLGSNTSKKGIISGIDNVELTSLDINCDINAVTVQSNKVWHAGNDGSGSGLDADTVDGIQVERIIYGDTSKGTVNIGNEAQDSEKANSITKSGFYRTNQDTSDNGKTFSNLLIHCNHPTGNSAFQIGTDYENGPLKWRHYNGIDSKWEAARTLVDTSNLEDTLAYWYENNENASSTTCATGGNRNVIESLRSKFKRCVAKPYGDDAALISYLNETDSNKWPDGSSMTYSVTRKENAMVYFPKYYHKTIERSPGIWRTYISEQQIDSDYIEEPERLVGTYEAYKFADYGWLTSQGGVESTHSQTIATFVTQAKVNGSMWGIQDYRIHATIARMFCAYYKTTNISTSNSSIPCSGGTKRYNYGKTGGTDSLGNKDGKLAVKDDAGYYSTNFLGIEDCYYSKWEFVQGINILKGKYVVYDGGSFPDKDVAELEAAGATNIRVVGYEPNPAATAGYNGWTKAVAQGKYGDVVPTAHGGSETTYYSDYSWFNPTGNRIFLRSGASADGSPCGVFMARASNASWASWTYLGARLAFYGKIVVVDSDTFKKMQA